MFQNVQGILLLFLPIFSTNETTYFKEEFLYIENFFKK